MTIEAIMGGLVGSLLTIVITKILEIIQKSKEHKYSLQKTFFEKKLQSAEAAVAQWYLAASSCFTLAKLFEYLSIEAKTLEGEPFEQLHNTIVVQLQKIEQASNQIANSIFLYFDIDDSTFWDGDSIKKFFSNLSELQTLNVSMDIFNKAKKLAKEAKDEKSESIIQNEINRIREDAIVHAKELALFYDKQQKEMVNLLHKIRLEMKKFET